MVLETIALPIGATGLIFPIASASFAYAQTVLFLCLFVWCTYTTRSTKLFKLQAFWVLFFIFGAVVINTVARCALKMNCLAHIYFRFLRSPDYSEIHDNGVTEDLIFKRSPRAVLNRWPRPYQGRALPTELQGQRIWPPAASPHESGENYESRVYLQTKTLSRIFFKFISVLKNGVFRFLKHHERAANSRRKQRYLHALRPFL
jgi:hypothetical protein